jgi:hypothetical protein
MKILITWIHAAMHYFNNSLGWGTPVGNKSSDFHLFYLHQAYEVSILLLKEKFKICCNHFFIKKYLVNNPHIFHRTIEKFSKIFNHGFYNVYLEQIELNEIDTIPNLSAEKETLNYYLCQLTDASLPEKSLQQITYQLEQLKKNISTLEDCYRSLPSLRTTLENFDNTILYPINDCEKYHQVTQF